MKVMLIQVLPIQIFDDDTMDRIQKYMNGEINTSTIANSNGNWQFHEKANDNVNWYKKAI